MSKRYLIFATFALVVATGVFAQAFSVTYLDGLVELKTAKGWTALSIGDSVPADGSVRISQSGSLELLRGKARITILKDGTYDMAALAKSTATAGTGTVGNAITQKLQSLVTEKPKTSQVGGVRGAAQGSTGDVMWVDETDETRTKIQTLLDQKKYADAVTAVNQAIKDATADTDTGELTYFLGAAYYGAGQAAKAYRALSSITPAQDTAWYARYVILKAQVLVDTASYTDALSVLTPFITAFPSGEATQVAYLLTYYSEKGLGDNTAAKAALEAGYKLDPASDTGKLIDMQRSGQ